MLRSETEFAILYFSVARERILDGEGDRKFKFRFDPKLPSICTAWTRKCSMGV